MSHKLLKKYYPSTFHVDLSGKRAEWEGIALLKVMDFKLLTKIYKENEYLLSENDKKRNVTKKTIRYKMRDNVLDFSYL